MCVARVPLSWGWPIIDMSTCEYHVAWRGRPRPADPILPHQALAFALAGQKRLGATSVAREACGNTDLMRLIFTDLCVEAVTVMFHTYRCCTQTVWHPEKVPILENGLPASLPSPRIMRPQNLPSFHWLGRVLQINTKSGGVRGSNMLLQWRLFLSGTLGGLWYDFTVIFPHNCRLPQTQTLLFESDPAHPVFDNDASYVEGLLTAFFMPWMMTGGPTSSQVTGSAQHGTRLDKCRQTFHVRRNGPRLQVFIFGQSVYKQLILASSTFHTPVERRTLMQYGVGGMGGWASIGTHHRIRKRVSFADARRMQVALDCVME